MRNDHSTAASSGLSHQEVRVVHSTLSGAVRIDSTPKKRPRPAKAAAGSIVSVNSYGKL